MRSDGPALLVLVVLAPCLLACGGQETEAPPSTRKPTIVRLDRPGDEPRAASEFAFVFEYAVGPGVDAAAFVADLPRRHPQAVGDARRFAAGRDLEEIVRTLFERCERVLGEVDEAPVYYLLLADPDGTNARLFVPDQITRAPAILLNLCALADEETFEIVVLHETVHAHQRARDVRLADLVVHEGVASYLSQRLRPGTEDHEALSWSEDDLRSAREHRDAILGAFRAARDEREWPRKAPFVVSGGRLPEVPLAPPRSGYWIGWLAARSWAERNPARPLRDLLTATADEILEALE
ncbi:MAG: gliding motility protein GldB-related protein [Planctomycetota bacterium]|jgi:hypothetical protein